MTRLEIKHDTLISSNKQNYCKHIYQSAQPQESVSDILKIHALKYEMQNLPRGNDHKHFGILTAVGNDAALGKVVHLAPQNELS